VSKAGQWLLGLQKRFVAPVFYACIRVDKDRALALGLVPRHLLVVTAANRAVTREQYLQSDCKALQSATVCIAAEGLAVKQRKDPALKLFSVEDDKIVRLHHVWWRVLLLGSIA
jgi:hypothetical protein